MRYAGWIQLKFFLERSCYLRFKGFNQSKMGSICWAQVTAKLPCHRTKEQVGGNIQREKKKTITALLFTMTFLLKYDERRALWDTIDVNGNGYVSFSEVSTVRTPS